MPHERTHVEAHAGRHDESGDTRNTVDYATDRRGKHHRPFREKISNRTDGGACHSWHGKSGKFRVSITVMLPACSGSAYEYYKWLYEYYKWLLSGGRA